MRVSRKVLVLSVNVAIWVWESSVTYSGDIVSLHNVSLANPFFSEIGRGGALTIDVNKITLLIYTRLPLLKGNHRIETITKFFLL